MKYNDCKLNYLQKSDTPLRLWWCATGPFAFLPIHAAGIYDAEGGENLSEYAVSSYTPTLNSLLASLPPKSQPMKVTVIIQPDNPGHGQLPNTLEELRNIEKHVPHNSLIRLGIPDSPASIESVLSHLPDSHIVHFACHGIQEMTAPLESYLLLHSGERLKISQIMKQVMPDASLAFISACETAKGVGNLPDEAMHLASSLMFAGFRGVIATMW
jgi:CHAT domain-containing protein